MEEQMQEVKGKHKREKHLGGIFIPAGFLIGMGVGFLIDSVPAGMFIGLGAGFLLYGISLFVKK